MEHSASRVDVRCFGFVVGAILGAAIPGMAQDTGSIVYRIDPEVSWIECCNPGWKQDCDTIGTDHGRFRLVFQEQAGGGISVWFEDIDTASSVAGLGGFLPGYTVSMVPTPWLSSDWLLLGEQTPGCTTVDGFVPEDLLAVSVDVQDPGDCPCCPDAPTTTHILNADAEPVLIAPGRPSAGESFQAEVNWFHPWAPVSGVETNVSLEGDLIRIDGDVTVEIDGDWVSGFYSASVDVPGLPPGIYRAQYWARPVMPGTPDQPYELQGEVTFQVQAPAIPADGVVPRLLLILGIAMVAMLALRGWTGSRN
jgi:hypothetical protein